MSVEENLQPLHIYPVSILFSASIGCGASALWTPCPVSASTPSYICTAENNHQKSALRRTLNPAILESVPSFIVNMRNFLRETFIVVQYIFSNSVQMHSIPHKRVKVSFDGWYKTMAHLSSVDGAQFADFFDMVHRSLRQLGGSVICEPTSPYLTSTKTWPASRSSLATATGTLRTVTLSPVIARSLTLRPSSEEEDEHAA